jgi:hypothetical protein
MAKKSTLLAIGEQTLHVLMGGGVAGPIAYFGAKIISPWISFPAGLIISRVVWSYREYKQHKKHDHSFPRWVWNMDLAFIDAGIVASLWIAAIYVR